MDGPSWNRDNHPHDESSLFSIQGGSGGDEVTDPAVELANLARTVDWRHSSKGRSKVLSLEEIGVGPIDLNLSYVEDNKNTKRSTAA